MHLTGYDTPTAKPRVFVAVTGNCQAMALASVLDGFDAVEARYFAARRQRAAFRCHTARFQHIGELGAETGARHAAGERIVVLEQVTAVAANVDLGALAAIPHQRLAFPNLEMLCLWPAVLYSQEHTGRLGPRRLFALDLASMNRVAARTPIDLRDIILAGWRSKLLFESPRHPGPALFSKLVDAVLAHLPGLGTAQERQAVVSGVAAASPFGGHVAYPAWASTTETYKCSWARTLIYRRWTAVRDHYARGDVSRARSFVRKVLDDPPDDPDFLEMVRIEATMLLAFCEGRLGRRAAAEAAMDEIGRSLDPETFMLRRSVFLREIGDVEGAISVLRDLAARGWDAPFDRDMLTELLMGQGRYHEAADVARRDVALGSRAPARRRLGFIELALAAERLHAAGEHFDAVKSTPLRAEGRRFAAMSRAYADQLEGLAGRHDAPPTVHS